MRWHGGLACLLAFGGWNQGGLQPPEPAGDATLAEARARMVREQLLARGIVNPRVLEAMAQVPRHAFIPAGERDRAYEDGPLPIGFGQTISQPYIVAFMTEALDPKPTDRVLEVGTGSGYQAAVLSCLMAEVFSIEALEPLAQRAEANLQQLGFSNVNVRRVDGFGGWPEAAPFDAIIVTCAPEAVPPALVDQLRLGGRMILPVGCQWGAQELVLLRKTPGGLEKKSLLSVRFVPMVPGRKASEP